MSLHAKIMNLPYLPGLAMCNATEAQLLAHKIGHRDARHAAAEVALEADAEIERLRANAARYEFLSQDFSPMGLDANAMHSWAYRRNFTLCGPNLDAAIDAAMAAKGLA